MPEATVIPEAAPRLRLPADAEFPPTRDRAPLGPTELAAALQATLWRRAVVEALGTAFLLAAVVGSGILGSRLAAGNVAIALLANSLATGAALYALIAWLGPLSGAHLNPLVTLAMLVRRDIARGAAAAYVGAQLVGGVIGVGLADAMFDEPLYAWATQSRGGPSQLLSEFVATFGLIGAVSTCARLRLAAAPAIVATYVAASFWFTASGFANPAVAVARSVTDTFAGIRPIDVPGFVAAELLGAGAAILLFNWLLPGQKTRDCET